MTKLRATSWLLPDTTLHHLNGTFVVEIEGLPKIPWLHPDEADALAASLTAAAAQARNYEETEDDD